MITMYAVITETNEKGETVREVEFESPAYPSSFESLLDILADAAAGAVVVGPKRDADASREEDNVRG